MSEEYKMSFTKYKASYYPFMENHTAGVLPLSSSEQNDLLHILDRFFTRNGSYAFHKALNNTSDSMGETWAYRNYCSDYVETEMTSWNYNYHDEDWCHRKFFRAERITEEEFKQKTENVETEDFADPFDCLKNMAEHCYVWRVEDPQKKEHGAMQWYGCRIAYVEGLTYREKLPGYYRIITACGTDRD